jgi:hypothetical protein
MMVGLAASVYLPSNFTHLMIVACDRAYDIYWRKGGQFLARGAPNAIRSIDATPLYQASRQRSGDRVATCRTRATDGNAGHRLAESHQAW